MSIDTAQMDPSGSFDPNDPRTQQRARLWATRRQALAREIAQLMNGSSTAESATAAREREMWWQRDPSVDPQALYAQGYPPEVVAAKELPNRLSMMMASGRKDDPQAQYDYVQRMTRLGPPQPSDQTAVDTARQPVASAQDAPLPDMAAPAGSKPLPPTPASPQPQPGQGAGMPQPGPGG